VLPTFYDDRARWVGLMRSSIAQLGARFNTNRMLAEYVDGLYLPAHLERARTAAAA
jgi:glycogen phosphorylase